MVATLMGLVMLACLGLASFYVVSTDVGPISVPGPQPSMRRLATVGAGAKQPPDGSPETAYPLSVSIPEINVTSPLEGLHLNPDGTLAVPKSFDRAGWWAEGTIPGEVGPAIVVGHVDSYTGPAVFYRLGALKLGSQVEVRMSDSKVLRFSVDRVARFSKDRFPTEEVYGVTDRPTLRLITCGGVFDRSHKSYKDNVVVFATSAA
jgi:sortase (surface protein transpeptidase)